MGRGKREKNSKEDKRRATVCERIEEEKESKEDKKRTRKCERRKKRKWRKWMINKKR